MTRTTHEERDGKPVTVSRVWLNCTDEEAEKYPHPENFSFPNRLRRLAGGGEMVRFILVKEVIAEIPPPPKVLSTFVLEGYEPTPGEY